MGNYGYEYYIENHPGYDFGYANYAMLFDPLILLAFCLIICGISWHLLKKERFRVHIIYLVFVGVLLVLPQFLVDLPMAFWGNDVLLLICIWDHYWTRKKSGQAFMSPQKARRVQSMVAAALSVCWVLCLLQVGFFQYLNESSLFVSAGYLWVHNYYHRKDINESKDSWFI